MNHRARYLLISDEYIGHIVEDSLSVHIWREPYGCIIRCFFRYRMPARMLNCSALCISFTVRYLSISVYKCGIIDIRFQFRMSLANFFCKMKHIIYSYASHVFSLLHNTFSVGRDGWPSLLSVSHCFFLAHWSGFTGITYFTRSDRKVGWRSYHCLIFNVT